MMLTTFSPESVALWFCLGFFIGLGWSLAAALVNRIAARF